MSTEASNLLNRIGQLFPKTYGPSSTTQQTSRETSATANTKKNPNYGGTVGKRPKRSILLDDDLSGDLESFLSKKDSSSSNSSASEEEDKGKSPTRKGASKGPTNTRRTTNSTTSVNKPSKSPSPSPPSSPSARSRALAGSSIKPATSSPSTRTTTISGLTNPKLNPNINPPHNTIPSGNSSTQQQINSQPKRTASITGTVTSDPPRILKPSTNKSDTELPMDVSQHGKTAESISYDVSTDGTIEESIASVSITDDENTRSKIQQPIASQSPSLQITKGKKPTTHDLVMLSAIPKAVQEVEDKSIEEDTDIASKIDSVIDRPPEKKTIPSIDFEHQPAQPTLRVESITSDLTSFIKMIQTNTLATAEAKHNEEELHKTVQNLTKQLEEEQTASKILKSEYETHKALANEKQSKLEHELSILHQSNESMKQSLSIAPSYRERINPGASIASEIVGKEDLEKIHRNIQEQENLLRGYQKENERLAREAKEATSLLHEVENRSQAEIHRLKLEITNSKEHYEKKQQELNSKSGLAEMASKLKRLELENQEITRLHDVKEQELHAELEKLRRQKKELESKVIAGVELTQLEQENTQINQLYNQIDSLKRSHMSEVTQLRETVRNNEQLLVHKEKVNNEQDRTIEQLKLSIDERGREVQQLQRKLKEKEDAEKQLESTVRFLRQEQEKIKQRYDKKISSVDNKSSFAAPHKVKELEAQLEKTRNFYRNKIKLLEGRIGKQEDQPIKGSLLDKHNCRDNWVQTEADMLILESVAKKEQEITMLKVSLSRKESKIKELQKEFQELQQQLSVISQMQVPNNLLIQQQQQSSQLQEQVQQLTSKLQASEATLISMQNTTTELLQQAHISTMEKIKQIQSLQQKELETTMESYNQMKQQNHELRSTIAQQNDTIVQVQQQLHSSNSKVVKLTEKIHELESKPVLPTDEKTRILHLQRALESSNALISQLKERISLLEMEVDHNSVRKDITQQLQYDLKETIEENKLLINKIQLLEKQIAEAPKPPGKNNLIFLETKVFDMETKHQRKQLELEAIIDKLKMSFQEEQKKWQRTIDLKNLEIEKFRTELDDIMDAVVDFSQTT